MIKPQIKTNSKYLNNNKLNLELSHAETTMLSDDFEGDLSLWEDNPLTNWIIGTTQALSPTHSVESGPLETRLYSNNLSMADATSINVTFYYWDEGVDGNDNVFLYYWNGASYIEIVEIGDLGTESQWNVYTEIISDSQFFKNDFHIYIDSGSIDINEYLLLDDVIIKKESGELPSECWTDEGTHIFIPTGCIYELPTGESYQI